MIKANYLPTFSLLPKAVVYAVAVLGWMSTCTAQHPAVCKISAQGAGGSGVMFSKGEEFAFVLTCDHVTEHLRQGAEIICTFPELAKHQMKADVKGTLIAWDKKIDASVVVINAKAVAPIRAVLLHQGEVRRGDKVISDGFPARGGRQQYVQLKGVVDGVHWDGSLSTTAIPSSGHSGGPIYTADWKLIGIMSGYRWSSEDPRRSWGLRIGPLRQFLENLKIRLHSFIHRERVYYCTLGFTQSGGCFPICQPYGGGYSDPIGNPNEPLYSDPGFGGADRPPDEQAPNPPDAAPAPDPTGPSIPDAGGAGVAIPGTIQVVIDYDQLLDLMAEDERFRGPPGPAGPAGTTGPAGADGGTAEPQEVTIDYDQLIDLMAEDGRFQGPSGPKGDPGAAPVIDHAAIAAALPPIKVRILDPDGKALQQQDVHLGGSINFQLKPQTLINK